MQVLLMNVGIGNIGDIIKNKYLYKENNNFYGSNTINQSISKSIKRGY